MAFVYLIFQNLYFLLTYTPITGCAGSHSLRDRVYNISNGDQSAFPARIAVTCASVRLHR